MRNNQKYNEKIFSDKYNYWKKIGYSVKFTKLPDRLKVEFKNNSENNSCFIEYLKDRIICYGDYLSYTFNDVNCNCNPKNVNYESIDYIIEKINKNNFNIYDFDYESANESLSDFYDDVLKEYLDDEYFYISKKDFIDEISNDYWDDESLIKQINNFLEDNGLQIDDLSECYPTGSCYKIQVISQLVMMKIIAEEYDKQEIADFVDLNNILYLINDRINLLNKQKDSNKDRIDEASLLKILIEDLIKNNN